MLRSYLGDVVQFESHPRQRRRLDREWLGRPILVSGDGIIGGDLTLLNLVYGFSGQAVEDEKSKVDRRIVSFPGIASEGWGRGTDFTGPGSSDYVIRFWRSRRPRPVRE